jgi:YhcH/YjgK/YiaL family protein
MMLFGNINNLESKFRYPEEIKEAIDYLKDTDWSSKENGTYELKGRDIYFNLFQYETEAEQERKPEVHRKYIDIQYIVSGTESIKIAVDTGGNAVFKEYNEENDILFYEGVEDESELVMTPGSFAVFFPNIVHKPNCTYREKSAVRKVVFKISVDLLNNEK